MSVYKDAFEAGRSAWLASTVSHSQVIAREACVAHLVAQGGEVVGSAKGGRAPICEAREVKVRMPSGELVHVEGGYDSNGPNDVWHYLRVTDAQGERLAGGRLRK